MLKKFLKLFKHEEHDDMPALDGSYFDYLLRQIQPGVARELSQCQEHDPLLLVIAETLRASMTGEWSDELARPLLDEHSPRPAATRPPPPPHGAPPPPPKDELVETQEFDKAEIAAAKEAAFGTLDSGDETLDGYEIPEDLHQQANETLDDEGSDASDADASGAEGAVDEDVEIVSEEEVVEEVLDEDSELIEDIVELEEPPAADDAATGERQASANSGLPRVDQREVLQAGRVFLGMLIENDRLPLDLQINTEEIALARELLVGYFVGNKDFERKAQQLLRVVERKFSEGQFSQARILLQLFQTDRMTRIKNDRNIFYEDMIQRLGIRRRHAVADDVLGEFAQIDSDAASAPIDVAQWLESNLFIKLHLFTRDRSAVERWGRLAGITTLPGGADNLLKYVPPRRWRTYYDAHDDAAVAQQYARDAIRQHVNSDTLANYVSNQMRTCYFVLRAVGDTGLEGYLDTFFDWISEAFEFNATVFLPEVYRRSMGEIDTMKSVFQDIYDRMLRQRVEAKLASFSDEEIHAALGAAIAHIHSCELNEIPPGNYDLGGFVFDQLFGVTYPVPEFAFKVHRLT